MKRIQMTMAALLVAGGLISAGSAYGQANDGLARVNVVKSDTKKVKLFTPAAVEMAVVDGEGIVLYKGDVRPVPGKATSVNLASLPDGHYYLTATNNDFWMSQGLTISNNQVSVDAQNTSTLVRPVLTAYAKNKFELLTPGVQKISVAIYDRVNTLVFSETYVKNEKHRFDLNHLPAGDYTFVVGPEFKQFSERVAVQR